ncbi:Hypothetical predicted protein [Xyrichtys novacula]|uniref:Uncharacterized protein n=1 Tax=Xyrichtys novacula TaxID=13765 RepID=A0AAV1HJL5_XYRNO|nr:Hypothetical predicted protein [Xyrichtys novacula]
MEVGVRRLLEGFALTLTGIKRSVHRLRPTSSPVVHSSPRVVLSFMFGFLLNVLENQDPAKNLQDLWLTKKSSSSFSIRDHREDPNLREELDIEHLEHLNPTQDQRLEWMDGWEGRATLTDHMCYTK